MRTYNQSVAFWSNRILIVLGALGIFISGVLSYTTFYQLEPPCGGTMGCSIVQQSEFSKLGGVSVSYIGLLGYVLLFALALARSVVVGKLHRRLSWAGFVAAAVGTVFSLYLTYTALAIVQQKCVWCLASLAVIIVTTIVHAALLQADTPESGDAPLGPIFGLGAAMLAFGAIGWRIQGLEAQIDMGMFLVNPDAVALKDLLPTDPTMFDQKVYGDKNAKVTIVEFADINCPTCRNVYPQIKQTMAKYSGIRLVFHHFPLIGQDGHKTSPAAAAIAEYAADKGMFWKYMDEVMLETNKERIKSFDGLVAVAGEAGLNKGDIVTIFQSDKPEHKAIADKYWERVDVDFNLGLKMAVSSTPTFILYAEGQKAKPIASRNIEEELDGAPYRDMVRKK